MNIELKVNLSKAFPGKCVQTSQEQQYKNEAYAKKYRRAPGTPRAINTQYYTKVYGEVKVRKGLLWYHHFIAPIKPTGHYSTSHLSLGSTFFHGPVSTIPAFLHACSMASDTSDSAQRSQMPCALPVPGLTARMQRRQVIH